MTLYACLSGQLKINMGIAKESNNYLFTKTCRITEKTFLISPNIHTKCILAYRK